MCICVRLGTNTTTAPPVTTTTDGGDTGTVKTTTLTVAATSIANTMKGISISFSSFLLNVLRYNGLAKIVCGGGKADKSYDIF